MSSAAVCPASHHTCLTPSRRRAIQALHDVVFKKHTARCRQRSAKGIKRRSVPDKKAIGSTRPARNRLNNWHNKIQKSDSVTILAHDTWETVSCRQNRQTVWETSDEGQGAVHHVKGAIQGAGTARVARGAHPLSLVARGQVRESCADESHVAKSQHFFSWHTGQRGTEFLSNCPMPKPERSRWLGSRICSQSWLTPMGAWFVLVQEQITRQARKYPARKVMPSFLLTHGGALKFSLEASSGPAVQPATQVPPYRRVCVIGRAEHFVLGDGAVRALRQGRRAMENCQPVSAEVQPSSWRVRVVGAITLDLASTWPRSPLYKWQYPLSEKRDHHRRKCPQYPRIR